MSETTATFCYDDISIDIDAHAFAAPGAPLGGRGTWDPDRTVSLHPDEVPTTQMQALTRRWALEMTSDGAPTSSSLADIERSTGNASGSLPDDEPTLETMGARPWEVDSETHASEPAPAAYFVEVLRARGRTRLLAVRETLLDALTLASAVGLQTAEVLIREVPRPYQAEAMLLAAVGARTWVRDRSGAWLPEHPGADDLQ